jgi:DNA-binding beta-propeller fold protein YncE
MTRQHLIIIIMATALFIGGCESIPEDRPMPQSLKDLMLFPPPPETPRFIYERTLRSKLDVVPEAEDDALRRMLTGESKRGEALGKPYAIAVHQGRVFVGDTGRRNVMVFDIPAQKFFSFGEEDPGQLGRPLGMDVDKDGNVYVLDGLSKLILVYNRDGKYQRTIGNPGDINRPAGLGVNADGSRVYAVDIGGTTYDTHRVLVYNGETGEKLSEIGKRGDKPGELNLPRDVSVDKDGSLYVVDSGNFRIEKFSPEGKFISTFGSIGRMSGQFSRPKEAALDKEGNIYVTDTAFGNFQIFNPEGKLLLAVGVRSSKPGPTHNMLPAGIAIDADGRIYFADQYFQKVDVYRPIALGPTEGFTTKDMIGKYDPDEATKKENEATNQEANKK